MWREKCEHKDVVLFYFSTKFCTYNIPLSVPKKENTYVQFSYVSKTIYNSNCMKFKGRVCVDRE